MASATHHSQIGLLISLLLTLHVLTEQATQAQAHSFLTQPRPYEKKFQLRECVGKECQQACPTIPSDMKGKRIRPTRTYRRGQKAWIRWARNNHGNGFISLSLVPVGKMMSRQWHRRLSFYEGCWAQGGFRCRGERLCGADLSGTGLQRRMTIPAIFPDGDYVLGMVWYGGVKMPETKKEFFSDFWSCSYVRIRGGPLAWKYQPYFSTGKLLYTRNTPPGKCFSSADHPDQCGKMGCRGPGRYRVPHRFRGGRRPRPITRRDVLNAMKH